METKEEEKKKEIRQIIKRRLGPQRLNIRMEEKWGRERKGCLTGLGNGNQ